MTAHSPLPADLATAHAMILAERAARLAAEAAVTGARLEIERLKLLLAKARREQYGQSSERGAKIIAQLELQLAELEETAAQEETAAEITAPASMREERAPGARKPARRPLPEHLPRERIVYPAPSGSARSPGGMSAELTGTCPNCGGMLRKLGEDVTESLESVPRTWKVIQHVREKFSCRTCEAITQPPAPSHPIARGRAGPSLLALVLVSKYGHHLPLHRQSAIYAREGVEIDVSTIGLCPIPRRDVSGADRADWVGAVSATAMPLVLAIQRHVLAAERLHADDTTVPVLAKEKTRIGRLWVHVRDDRPFGGSDPPAAAFFYSPDRGGEHPERQLADFSGIVQADAYAGFNRLYEAGRLPGPILEAACWAHARRKFFELAAVAKAPIAAEAVRRIDQLFAIERDINGRSVDERRRARQEKSAPLVAELEPWLRAQQNLVSRKSETSKAIAYTLKRWTAFTRFLDDGHICMSNNAAERALRGIAVGRGNWTFAGSDRGGERAAAIYTLIETAKLNDIDPQAWLADVLARISDHPAKRLDELLPWNWKTAVKAAAAA